MSGWTDYQLYLRTAVNTAIAADTELTTTSGTLGVKAIVALPPSKDPDLVEMYASEIPFIGTLVTAASGADVVGSNAYIHPMRVRVYMAVRQNPLTDAVAIITRMQSRVIYVLSRLCSTGYAVLNGIAQILLAGPMETMGPKPSEGDEFLLVADVVAVFNVMRCD